MTLFSQAIYTVNVTNDTGIASGTAVTDVFAIQAPETNSATEPRMVSSNLRIREVRLGQYSDPPAAGAEEILGVRLMRFRGDTGIAFLDTGTDATRRRANPLDSRRATDTGGSDFRITTMGVVGGAIGVVDDSGDPNAVFETIVADAWNIAVPYWYYPPEEEQIVVESGDVFLVRISAPADSITLNGTVVFEKVGTI